jgi:hypothetical protein
MFYVNPDLTNKQFVFVNITVKPYINNRFNDPYIPVRIPIEVTVNAILHNCTKCIECCNICSKELSGGRLRNIYKIKVENHKRAVKFVKHKGNYIPLKYFEENITSRKKRATS